MSKFTRPSHIKDDGHAHIKFGEDPRPCLRQYGYCVVEDVFTKQECIETINSMWKWLENLETGIHRNNSKTWINDNWPPHLHQGMIHHSIAHEEFIWKNREHPNIIKVFSQIFNTDQLLSSFDGVCIGRPPVIDTKDMILSWLHTDQNIIPSYIPIDEVYDSEFYCIQGILNYEDVNDDDASLFIGKETHLTHTDLFVHNGKKPIEHWYVLDKYDADWLINEKHIEFVKLNAPAGSILLFDTRNIHQGYPGKSKKNNNTFRYVQYVSMTPATRTTKKDLALKRESIEKCLVTSHFSSNNIKCFDLPNYNNPKFDKMFKNIHPPDCHNWSIRRKQLAGLIPYDELKN